MPGAEGKGTGLASLPGIGADFPGLERPRLSFHQENDEVGAFDPAGFAEGFLRWVVYPKVISSASLKDKHTQTDKCAGLAGAQ